MRSHRSLVPVSGRRKQSGWIPPSLCLLFDAVTRHIRPSPASPPTRFISLSLSLASRDELTDGLGLSATITRHQGFISIVRVLHDSR